MNASVASKALACTPAVVHAGMWTCHFFVNDNYTTLLFYVAEHLLFGGFFSFFQLNFFLQFLIHVFHSATDNVAASVPFLFFGKLLDFTTHMQVAEASSTSPFTKIISLILLRGGMLSPSKSFVWQRQENSFACTTFFFLFRASGLSSPVLPCRILSQFQESSLHLALLWVFGWCL